MTRFRTFPFLRHTLLGLICSCFIQSAYSQISPEKRVALEDKANNAVAEGDFQTALDTVNQLLTDNPNTPGASNFRYLGGISAYNLNDYDQAMTFLTGYNDFRGEKKEVGAFYFGATALAKQDYDKAIAALAPLSKTPLDDVFNLNIRPYVHFTLARAYLGKSEKLAKDNPVAATTIANNAIPVIDLIMKEDEEGQLTADATILKASALVAADLLTEAETMLNAVQSDPNSVFSDEEINSILGFILKKQYSQLLAEFKEDEAAVVIDRTRKLYSNLLKSSDLLIANQAAFELANLELATNSMESALKAFRAIRSKDDLIQNVEARLIKLKGELQKTKNNPTQLKRVQNQIRRVEQKLIETKAKPDLSIDALIRTADVYLQLGKYDEARTIYRHAIPFLSEERAASTQGQIIVTLALQGLVKKADVQYESFKKENPKNPIIKSIPFLIGVALIQQSKFDEALEQFQRNLKEFPDSPVTDQIPKMMATAYRGKASEAKDQAEADKLLSEAVKTLNQFIKDAEAKKLKVPKSSIEDSKLQLSQILAGQGKDQEALKILASLIESASTPEIRETAQFTQAGLFEKTGKIDEAVKAYQSFAQEFATSERADDSAFKAAQLLDSAKKYEEARAAYRSFIENFESSPFHVSAYAQIWKSFKRENKPEEMIKAQEELITAYPTSQQAFQALFDRGETYRKSPDTQEEAIQVFENIVDQVDGLQSDLGAAEKLALFRYANFGLIRIADMKRDEVKGMIDYSELSADDQSKYVSLNEEIIELMKKAINDFPHPDLNSFNFRKMVQSMINLIEVGKAEINDYSDYFSTLAGTTRDSKIKSAALLGRADLFYNSGQKDTSLPFYKSAFESATNPSDIPWNQYDQYGTLLIENKKWEDATQIAKQLIANWGSTPKIGASAMAASLFIEAKAAEGQGDRSRANKFFQELKQKYPNSSKGPEVDFGFAIAQIAEDQFDEGIDSLKSIVRSSRAANELKARALIEIGLALEQVHTKGKTTKHTNIKGKEIDALELATNNLQRVDITFLDQKELSAKALYHAARIYKTSGNTEKFTSIKQRLLSEYSNTEWAKKARKDL
ncbi:MAG: tetratricopeptide repeat protein [Verrucomicrobiota bacterium]